jgi:hypothetical protein
MKKKLSIPLFLLALNMSLLAQQVKVSELERWSVQLKGGVSALRANYDHDKGKFARDYSPEFGIEVERIINPLIGVSLEYMYQTILTDLYKSRVNQLNVVLPINISNLFSPTREWNLVNFYFTPGAGIGVGGYDDFVYNGKEFEGASQKIALGATFGLSWEFNVSEDLAIGAQIQYRWNSNSDYKPDGLPSDYGSKDFYTGNVSVRYKFKGKDNVRNITPNKFFRGVIRYN